MYVHMQVSKDFRAYWLISTTFDRRVLLLKTFCLYRLHENQGPGRRDKPSLCPHGVKRFSASPALIRLTLLFTCIGIYSACSEWGMLSS